MFDFSSISKISKSEDSILVKDKFNAEYATLLKDKEKFYSDKEQKIENDLIGEGKDALSEMYKSIIKPESQLENNESLHLKSDESGIKLKPTLYNEINNARTDQKVNLGIVQRTDNRFKTYKHDNISPYYEVFFKKKVGNEIIESDSKSSIARALSDFEIKKNPSIENHKNASPPLSKFVSENKVDSAKVIGNKIPGDKRRKSLLKLRRSSLDPRKRLSEMNPGVIQEFVKKSEHNTPYGKNMRYIKILDIALAIVVFFNVVVSLIDNELYLSETKAYVDVFKKDHNKNQMDREVFDYMETRVITVQENLLRYMNVIMVIFILIAIYFHYLLKVRLLRADQMLSEYEGIWKAGFTGWMLLEMLIGVSVYPPHMNHVIQGKMLGHEYAYNINSLVCVAVTLKSYIILRVYTYFSRWTSDTARSICYKHNIMPGVHFAMKAELKKRPYTMLVILSTSIVTICAFAIRTFEYFVYDEASNENRLQYLANSIWLLVITMTTVGYGDYFPKSHYGRFIGVVSCVIGLLLVSLIIVSLAIISEFNIEEKKAYSILKKIKADNNATNKALDVISTFLRLRMMVVESGKYKLSERFIVITQLKKGISTFKNDYKIANSYSLPVDEMLKLLENKLKDDISTLSNSIKKIAHIDKSFKQIADDQKLCILKMEEIAQRQEMLGRYMVEFNNENFKENYLKFLNSKEAKKSKKSTSAIRKISDPMLHSHQTTTNSKHLKAKSVVNLIKIENS